MSSEALIRGQVLRPGMWGVSHGSGWLGAKIRQAEEQMMLRAGATPAAAHEMAWAGHAFMYVGPRPFTVGGTPVPAIVEAEWPRVKLSPVTAHSDAIWAVRQPLDEVQRHAVSAVALGMLGQHYDPFVFPVFMLRAGGMALSHDLTGLFTDPRIRICSGVVEAADAHAGVDLTGLATAAIPDPNLTSPADLFAWGIMRYWMDRTVPAW